MREQERMLLIMDLAVVISEYIGEKSLQIMPQQVEKETGFIEEVKEAMKMSGSVS